MPEPGSEYQEVSAKSCIDAVSSPLSDLPLWISLLAFYFLLGMVMSEVARSI
jgi:hypothetical protein